ncbi:MAG: type II toxin-antitoxin system VapC family toxin [Candidatus Binatia bacterium]
MAVYLDSSAIAKLVVQEPESAALRRYLRAHPQRISCSLSRTEVLRAVRHLGPAALHRARQVLRRVDLIQLDDALLDAAATLDPRILRSLDAIHLAAAQLVSPELEAVITYDRRMADTAALLGFAVVAPA